jgi:hypothetical protein
MTKNETLDLLRSQLPGFYSVDQVINLISEIEESKEPYISSDKLKEIAQYVVDEIEINANRGHIIDMDSIEFEINYDRRIEVTDVPIDFDIIRECIEEGLSNFFENK